MSRPIGPTQWKLEELRARSVQVADRPVEISQDDLDWHLGGFRLGFVNSAGTDLKSVIAWVKGLWS